MAHDLENDKSMFYAGAMPWHGLGVALPANVTWEEATQAVGFYDAVEQEVFVAGIPDAIAEKKALVRSDNGAFLSIVGKDYGVVQFSHMAEAVMTAAGREAVFHTGGLLGHNGIRGWLLGELGEPIRVKGDESEIRRYFLATGAHTGGNCATLANVATRVVCANTLGSALREKGGHRWSIRHTKNAAQRVQDAAKSFRHLVDGYEKFGQLANLMAETRFSSQQMAETVDAVFPLPEDKKDASDALFAKRAAVTRMFDHGTGITAGIRGTAWAAFQAWTEYADHGVKVRALPARSAQAGRLESVWFGAGAELKHEALQVVARVGGFKVAA